MAKAGRMFETSQMPLLTMLARATAALPWRSCAGVDGVQPDFRVSHCAVQVSQEIRRLTKEIGKRSREASCRFLQTLPSCGRQRKSC